LHGRIDRGRISDPCKQRIEPMLKRVDLLLAAHLVGSKLVEFAAQRLKSVSRYRHALSHGRTRRHEASQRNGHQHAVRAHLSYSPQQHALIGAASAFTIPRRRAAVIIVRNARPHELPRLE
jgi:hypothetical protein